MSISSRTPEGMPSECPLCGAKTSIEYSEPGQDASCPNCGHLLLASTQLIRSLNGFFQNAVGTAPGTLTVDTPLSFISDDSLEMVELIMTMQEEFDIYIPDEEVDDLTTFGDVVRWIEKSRRGD